MGKKIFKVKKVIIFIIILILPSPVLASDKQIDPLYEIAHMGNNGKKISYNDQIFFMSHSIPHTEIGYNKKDVRSFLNSNISFLTNSEVISKRKRTISKRILDDHLTLILSDGHQGLTLNGEDVGNILSDNYSSAIQKRKFFALVHSADISNVTSQLSSAGMSAYRISYLLGLGYESFYIRKAGESSMASCTNLIGEKYLCDKYKVGPLSITGSYLLHYSNICNKCTELDIKILKSLASHHLLRAKPKKIRIKGERLFSKNKNDFIDININYNTLRDIYLRSLSD